MIGAKSIPEELTEDYYDNHEARSIAFANVYMRIAGCLDDYLLLFRDIIDSQEPTLVRKNLLEFLKLMTNLKHLSLDSQFANSIFEDLMKIGLNRNKYREEF